MLKGIIKDIKVSTNINIYTNNDQQILHHTSNDIQKQEKLIHLHMQNILKKVMVYFNIKL